MDSAGRTLLVVVMATGALWVAGPWWSRGDLAGSENGAVQSSGTTYDVTEFTRDPSRIRVRSFPAISGPIRSLAKANVDSASVAQTWYRTPRQRRRLEGVSAAPDRSGTWLW